MSVSQVGASTEGDVEVAGVADVADVAVAEVAGVIGTVTPAEPAGVGTAVPTAGEPVVQHPAPLHSVAAPIRRPRDWSEVPPLLSGAAVSAAISAVSGAAVSWICVALWSALAMTVSLLKARRRPSRHERLMSDLRLGAVLCCAIALSGVVEVTALGDVRWAMAAVGVGSLVSVLSRAAQRDRGRPRRVFVVGNRQAVNDYVQSARGSLTVVAGCCVLDSNPGISFAAHVPVVTSPDQVGELLSSIQADAVLVLPGTDPADVRRLSWSLSEASVPLNLVAPVVGVARHRIRVSKVDGEIVLSVAPTGVSNVETLVKSVLDRAAALGILILTSPMLLALVVGVRLGSSGPAFFVQTRIGLDGKPFPMVKLRSMYVDAEAMKQALIEENESDGALFKIRRDPRVTKIGYWIRRFSLDELPQLFNVVRGEMSLVGPRPALPSEVATYDDSARRRLVVKPGMTGLWQVSGRSDLPWEESVRLDLYYADNWRLVGDLVIALRTVGAVTGARGAY